MTVVTFRVQDILDFEIFFVILDIQDGRCRRKSRGERRRSDGVEEGDVKDIMKVSHCGW